MFWRRKSSHTPLVISWIHFNLNEDKSKINSLDFLPYTPEATTAIPESTTAFVLQIPFEYIVCIRLQVQTNLGRRSKFVHCLNKSNATRFEKYVPDGLSAICTFSIDTFDISLCSPPPTTRKKLHSLVLLSSVRELLLSNNSTVAADQPVPSAAIRMMKGGRKAVAIKAVTSGLAGKMFHAGEDGDALIRLILEGEERRQVKTLENVDDPESVSFPSSLLRALTENSGESFEFSLMHLLTNGRDRDGRSPLLRIMFNQDGGMIAKTVFAKKKNAPSLAELMITPDRVRGNRSLIQLLTDEEANDDIERPSALRSMLTGEERGEYPSLLRMIFLKTELNPQSVMELMLKGESDPVPNSLARRLLSETDQAPLSLMRLFFSDTPDGKPALAKYVLGGETTKRGVSLLRLLIQGEARNQSSLLRLMVLDTHNKPSVLRLLTCQTPSLLDILLLGEVDAKEESMARMMLGTTFTIENGRFRMGNLLGELPTKSHSSVVDKKLVSVMTLEETQSLERRLKKGLTLAKVCMLGEEDGGPGISVMRMLLFGEEEEGISILRLMMTGEEKGEISPLRIIFTGIHAAFVGAHTALKKTHDLREEQSLLELALNPKQWIGVFQTVSKSVMESVADTQTQNMTWKQSFDKLIDLGKTRVLRDAENWQENLAFLYTAFSRIKSFGPEFAVLWKKTWDRVAKEVKLTGERVSQDSTWRTLAPFTAIVVEAIADQNWPQGFLAFAQLIAAVEHTAAAGGTSKEPNFGKLVSVVEEISNWAPKWF